MSKEPLSTTQWIALDLLIDGMRAAIDRARIAGQTQEVLELAQLIAVVADRSPRRLLAFAEGTSGRFAAYGGGDAC